MQRNLNFVHLTKIRDDVNTQAETCSEHKPKLLGPSCPLLRHPRRGVPRVLQLGGKKLGVFSVLCIHCSIQGSLFLSQGGREAREKLGGNL